MGMFQAAAALWQIPIPGVTSNLKWCFVCTFNKSRFAGLLCKVIIRPLSGFMLSFAALLESKFHSYVFETPLFFWAGATSAHNSFTWWANNLFQQKRACNTWDCISGGELLEPLLGFVGFFWSTQYLEAVGDRIFSVSEPPGNSVSGRAGTKTIPK